MGKYRYYCKAQVFGCQCSRSRNTSILAHETKCVIVKKFKKYLDLEAENTALKEEIARLIKVRGRPEVKFSNVNIETFFKNFLKNELYKASWKTLFGNRKENAIPALFRLFLAVSPRFYKLTNCRKMVEICGFFSEIQTKNEIHVHDVGDFGYACMYYLADSVEDYSNELGLSNSDLSAMNISKILKMNGKNRAHTAFIRNSLMYETTRKAKGLPIKFNNVKIDISTVNSKKKKPTVVVI